jgi:hypothetical protein
MIPLKKSDIDVKSFFAYIGVFYLNMWGITLWVIPNIHPMSFFRSFSIALISFVVGVASKALLKK